MRPVSVNGWLFLLVVCRSPTALLHGTKQQTAPAKGSGQLWELSTRFLVQRAPKGSMCTSRND
jgi:hypothetical protein